ncbi:MAG: transposase, partial [Candidatus Schmidhempelia sp.]|nr:transposase [Candidatus Schmidhempelia sp.]
MFVTKYRTHVFPKNMIDDLKPMFEKVCLGFDARFIEFDGKNDDIHLLDNYPPKIALSSLV